jgi:hypothetical protein
MSSKIDQSGVWKRTFSTNQILRITDICGFKSLGSNVSINSTG